MSTTIRFLILLLCAAALGVGCNDENKEKAKAVIAKGGELAGKAADKGGELAGKAADKGAEGLEYAKDKGGELADKAKDKGAEGLEYAKDKSAQGYEYAKDKGAEGLNAAKIQTIEGGTHLSVKSQAWFWSQAPKDGSGISAIIVKGHQVANVASEISDTVKSAIDSDTQIEPIYQPLDDAAAADKAIGDMPRVEVIDGLQIGFEDMGGVHGTTHENQSGYLILWRRETHLVGFIYRSQRKIDIKRLVQEAPRLIALINTTLD